MKANTDMTIYHKTYDGVNRKDKWQKHIVHSVMWQGGKGASVNQGFEQANDVKVFTKDMTIIDYVKIGDIIVKGNVNKDIKTQQDLSNEEFYNVTTIINYDYGSEGMKHIELGGK